jgi:pyruvate/2-oxoglutarate/acetoin dehydrogenase E1 component
MDNQRTLSYAEALREATEQEMERDVSVIVFGIDVDDPKAIQGTTRGLPQKFGSQRIFGTPLSEDAMTGVAIGMALAGLRPIHIHIRMDFMLLAMNQIVNVAAKSHYMYGGQVNLPVVFRGMVGKSWGQGAQHSQSLYSLFAHIPGLKVVAPSTPYDAKGCLVRAVRDNNPVIYVEHRLLHSQKGPVPQDLYEIVPGKSRITEIGKDITLVGISYMQLECLRAHHYLQAVGIQAEVIDPIWLSPLDTETIAASVEKTGRLLVVDNDWESCGISSEIITQVALRLQRQRDFRVERLGFASTTCPPTPTLEALFYPSGSRIASKAYEMVSGKSDGWSPQGNFDPAELEFRGPF